MTISYLNDPSAELIKSYMPPFRGTWKTLPSHLLPDDVIAESNNVTLLGGVLRSRTGLLSYDTFNFPDRVIGSFIYIDSKNHKTPICSTNQNVYRYDLTWNDITNGVLLSIDATQVRMTSIQQGNQVYLIYANGVDRLKYIDEFTMLLHEIPPYIPSSTAIPICIDICTSFSRIVGITPPYTVQWSDVVNNNYLGFTSWPALNQVVLSDTEDSLVAIRNLGTIGIAVYKEGNIFIGIAQAGSNAQAFRFEHRGEYEGPISVNAIVNVSGVHIYMTPTGRVGLFDGSTHNWLCDGLWTFLQDTLDIQYAYKAFGVYNYKTNEVQFWYPRVGDLGLCKGVLTINLPFPLAGVNSYSYFLGNTAFECSNGMTIRIFNGLTSPLVFSNNLENGTRKTFILDKKTYTDDSVVFDCGFSTGTFKPEPPKEPTKDKSDIYRPIVEYYATRDDDRGTVDVSVLTSNQLESNGAVSEAETLDLASQAINTYIGFNDTGSFIGIRSTWKSDSKIEYKGADVYGRRGN